jgi:hypothetical protein
LDTLEYIWVPHPSGVTDPTVGPGSHHSPSGFNTVQYSPSDFNTVEYIQSNANLEHRYPICDAPLPFPDQDLENYNQFETAEYGAYLCQLNGRQLLHSVASVDSPVYADGDNRRQLLRSPHASHNFLSSVDSPVYAPDGDNGRQLLHSPCGGEHNLPTLDPHSSHREFLPVEGHPGFFFDPTSSMFTLVLCIYVTRGLVHFISVYYCLF